MDKDTATSTRATSMRDLEKALIELGSKRGNKTGSCAVFSPGLCRKFKEAQDKAAEQEQKQK